MKLYCVITLDGFTARIDGSVDFMLPYMKNEDYSFANFLKRVDCIVMNEPHYDLVQSDGRKWYFEDVPYYVLSTLVRKWIEIPNIKSLLCASHKGAYSLIGHLKELQNRYSNIWLMGDKTLISDCFNLDCIDEITFVTLPITIGAGDRLYMGHYVEHNWRLVDNKCFNNGVTFSTYTRISAYY